MMLALALALACSAESSIRLGRAELDRHRLDRAEEYFHQALDRSPRHPGALAGMGWTMHAEGKEIAAGEAFERCLEVAPDDVECLRGRASVAMLQGDFASARQDLTVAQSVAPFDNAVRASFALLAVSSGNLGEASGIYEELVNSDPGEAAFHLGLAQVRFHQQRWDESGREVIIGLKSHPKPRYEVELHLLAARLHLAADPGQLDPARCAAEREQLEAHAAAAKEAVRAARAVGIDMPGIDDVELMVAKRWDNLHDKCGSVVP